VARNRESDAAGEAESLRQQRFARTVELELEKRVRELEAEQRRTAELEDAMRRVARAATKYKKAALAGREQAAVLAEENAKLRAQIDAGFPQVNARTDLSASVIAEEGSGDSDTGQSARAASIDSLIENGPPMEGEERHRFLRSVGRVWLCNHCGIPM
jgi:hypothetical protein